MSSQFIIAIDGLSSSGKSTLAKQLAEKLGLRFIDSGAYYRAVTLYLIEHRILFNNPELLSEALLAIEILFEFNLKSKESKTFLNSLNVEAEIRSLEVSQMVSEISALPQVREFISNTLRRINDDSGIVMDGRDIGTVVFPEASVKIYLTANEKTRSKRRFEEMKRKGVDVTKKQIQQNLSGRDLLDSTRKTAPLKQADDAYVIDNSCLTLDQQLDKALGIVEPSFKKHFKK